MRHPVPFLPLGQILEAKIGRQVDDPHAGFQQPRRLFHRYAVRRGEKHHVAALRSAVAGSENRSIDVAPQAGKHPQPAMPASLREVIADNLRAGMLRQDPQQLDSGVPGAADDADLDHLFLYSISRIKSSARLE